MGFVSNQTMVAGQGVGQYFLVSVAYMDNVVCIVNGSSHVEFLVHEDILTRNRPRSYLLPNLRIFSAQTLAHSSASIFLMASLIRSFLSNFWASAISLEVARRFLLIFSSSRP